ncbi:glucosamine-6-phosphate deaminase NagB-II [Pseudocolwellia sp. HL-MZ19]|uniref:glucosamine-6-phosphate deaminase NagB-II n=1 Tax=Pseudocolwellia sp. HL-MZ19 TaxID=3400846 RepID=UPI003CEEC100
MTTTIMAREAAQTPDVIALQLKSNLTVCEDLVKKIKQFDPAMVYIIGRGSSDHAGVFAKYLIEIELGIPVSSSAPSVHSVYHKNLKLDKALVLVISQSGGSPDIIAQAKAAKESGALTIALVNTPNSPLSNIVNAEIPLCAGEEKAIAATKSYLATLSAILQLVACWKQDTALLEALNNLPTLLLKAQQEEQKLTLNFLKSLAHCVVLGRGLGYAVSREIALKLKEVCSIQAEAFSSAEFLHGPVTLVENKLSVIDVEVLDESESAHKLMMDNINSRGSRNTKIGFTIEGTHPRCIPLLILQRFYLDIEKIAREMGLDPDQPPGLKKITKTL